MPESSEEVKQCAIQLVRVCQVQAMRRALDHHELASLHELVGALARSLKRHYPVRVSVDHKRGDFYQRKVFSKVSQPGRHGIQRASGRRASTNIPAELERLLAYPLASVNVKVVKVCKERREEGKTVGSYAGLYLFKG